MGLLHATLRYLEVALGTSGYLQALGATTDAQAAA